MKKSIFVLLYATLLGCSAEAERAAVVHSDWSKSAFASEYDKHLKALGWSFDKFQNTRLPELTEKLGDYQFVIAASVANYTQTVNIGPYAAAWRIVQVPVGLLLALRATYNPPVERRRYSLGEWP